MKLMQVLEILGLSPRNKRNIVCVASILLWQNSRQKNVIFSFDWHDTMKSQYRSKDGPSGLMDTYNWHKHPGGPEGPSSMDIDF